MITMIWGVAVLVLLFAIRLAIVDSRDMLRKLYDTESLYLDGISRFSAETSETVCSSLKKLEDIESELNTQNNELGGELYKTRGILEKILEVNTKNNEFGDEIYTISLNIDNIQKSLERIEIWHDNQ